MKNIKYVIFFFVLFLNLNFVYAKDNIKKITMDIYVDRAGNANVMETWDVSINNGTEGYKPYYNLGNSKITNYKVSMNNGTNFQTLSYWDIDASFSEKAYKAGLHEIDDGVELCFGISKYGNNTYTMNYTITNFVSTTNDADMIYWQLIPYDLSSKPDYVYIKIYSDFPYSNDTPVWGYGNYGGLAYVYDGVIELVHEDELDSDEYMVVLAKFPKGTFNTTSVLDKDFNEYYEMAEDGATAYTKDKTTAFDIIMIIFGVFCTFIPFIIIITVIASSYNDFGTKKIKFRKDGKKIKDAPYFRDIPLNKDIFKAYWVAGQYKLIKNKTDFLGTILLKWLKDGNVCNVTVQSKFLKKEERAIKLLNKEGLTELELELFEMMERASGDGVLESNEFTRWCKANYNKILKWFNRVVDDTTINFKDQGLLLSEKGTFGISYIASEELKNHAMEMSGLKKFLLEFSNIKNRESIEVKLWEYYLIYAQIFGIAKAVAKEFKKLYPDIITDEYYNDIIFIHTISYQGVNAASVARQRAESYSSGGGGFSSGGGGFGSFGGGGGGGGFR